MDFPPHLLDELARVFARVAVERFLKELSARAPRQEGAADEAESEQHSSKGHDVADEGVDG